MVKNYLFLFLIILGILLMSTSCDMKNFFKQPTVEVEGYTLVELPTEVTKLNLDITITNNDSREAYITDVTYIANIEGVVSEEMETTLNKDVPVGTPLEATIPLNLPTEGAVLLLSKLENGEELHYRVIGTFHVEDDDLGEFHLPLDIEGDSLVDVGYEEYFEQPEITVNNITGSYTINGFTSYTFNLIVNCTVQNMDSHSATVDKVVYKVYLEGVPSNQEVYYPNPVISLAAHGQAGDSVDLNLPLVFNTNPAQGAQIVAGASDSTLNYTIEGTFNATTELTPGRPTTFTLPLYKTGTVPATIIP